MQRVSGIFVYMFWLPSSNISFSPVIRGQYFEVETIYAIKCKFYSDIKAKSLSFTKPNDAFI